MDNGVWPSLDIVRYKKSITALQDLVERQARTPDEDVTKQLARFLVIRSCGFLEQVSKECCKFYLRRKSAPRAAEFGVSWLDKHPNPTPHNLVTLIRRFDGGWADELEDLLMEDDRRLWDDIAFLVDRRNRIAHGLSEGITVRKAIHLAERSQDIAEWFIMRLDPNE